MTPPYIADYLPKCEEFEGCVRWMYLDTRSNITVGVGFEILTELEACAYPFMMGTLSSTVQEIAAAFTRTKAMQPGRVPLYYFYAGCPQLTEAYIDNRLLNLLSTLDAALQQLYSDFAQWPDSAKMATLDMGFNLGETKLKTGYPRFEAAAVQLTHLTEFHSAAAQADFRTMAAQCHRGGIAQARNDWTIQMFNAAATTA